MGDTTISTPSNVNITENTQVPRRNRSLSLPLQHVEMYAYHGTHTQPPNINSKLYGKLVPSNTDRQVTMMDFIWFLTRWHMEETLFEANEHHRQTVPGWNTFNVNTEN